MVNQQFVYDALVPPGGFTIGPDADDKAPDGEVGATRVTFKFKIKSETPGVDFDQEAVMATLKVDRQEDHEEYFRVLTECAEARGSSYDNDLKELATFLASKPSEQDVIKRVEKLGDDMFRAAVTNVQEVTADGSDRPLYWARLTARVLIKQATRDRNFSLDNILKTFEKHSRGIPMPKFTGAEIVKVAVLGFDPFTLNSKPGGGSPAGLVALYLNGATKLKLDQKGGPIPVTVRSCVLPVRFADFDGNLSTGIVEDAVSGLIDAADLVITLSRASGTRYDIEQSACRFRGETKDNRQVGAKAEVPDSVEFRFTTLPWEGLVIRDNLTLPGPDATNNLQFNQYFKAKRAGVDTGHGDPGTKSSTPGTADAFLETPIDPDEPPLDARDVKPRKDDMSESSSTGNFLSNEVFYRVAKLRDNAGRGIDLAAGKKPLPMGHIHLPEFTGTGLDGPRKQLFAGITQIMKKLLFDIKRNLLVNPVQTFRIKREIVRAKPNQPMEIPITVDNRMGRVGFEARVELAIATPVAGSFEAAQFPNVMFKDLKEIVVGTLKFKGGPRGIYPLACTLLETVNEVAVFRKEVIVKVADPQISTVDPLDGKQGASVTITGEDFVPRAGKDADELKVKFGGMPAAIVSNDGKKITCRVPTLPPGMVDVELVSPHGKIVFGVKFNVTA